MSGVRDDCTIACLEYSTQNWLVTTNIEPEKWMLADDDIKRYLMNISVDIDQAFMYQVFPPGSQTSQWTHGEKACFETVFSEWAKLGIDPRRHWGLFSLSMRGKTGNQCKLHFMKRNREGKHYSEIRCESEAALRYQRSTAFRRIWSMFSAHLRAPIVNSQSMFPGRGMDVGTSCCYASPLLQFLIRVHELMNILHGQVQFSGADSCHLAANLLYLRQQIQLPGPPIIIQPILSQLGLDCSSQQDPHELFLLLMTKLGNELQGANRMKLSDMFQLEYSDTSSAESEQPRQLVLCIDLRTPERDCTLCHLLSSSMPNCTFHKLPHMLALYIPRYKVTHHAYVPETNSMFDVQKVTSQIDCPEELCLGEKRYQLVLTVRHCGELATSGHYIGIIRDGLTDIYVDGSNVSYIRTEDGVLRERIASSHPSFLVYRTSQIHIQTSFSLSPMMERQEPSEGPQRQNQSNLHTNVIQTERGCHAPVPRSPVQYTSCEHTGFHFRPSSPRTARYHIHCKRTPASSKNSSEFRQGLLCDIEATKSSQHYLNLHQMLYIAHESGRGASMSRIANDLQCHRSTVGRFLSSPTRLQHFCHSYSPNRESMVDNQELQRIILNESQDLNGKRLSCRRLAHKISDKYRIEISKETVR